LDTAQATVDTAKLNENAVKTVISASAETNVTKAVKAAKAKAASAAIGGDACAGMSSGECHTANLPDHHFDSLAQKKKEQELAQAKTEDQDQEENESESENESEDEDSGDESDE
jgi:hypothetical protein